MFEVLHILARSFAIRVLAIWKVSSNKEKNTSGIYKVLFKSNKDKFNTVFRVKNLSYYRIQLVCRVYIFKDKW